MSSLFILNRMPVLGFNTQYRLEAADERTDQGDSFVDSKLVSDFMLTANAFSIGGCLPGVSFVTGIARLGLTIRVYESTAEEAESASDAWIQDRQWTCIKMGTLAVAEICQLGIILAPLHLIATIFDRIVAVRYYSAEGMLVKDRGATSD